VKRTLAIACLAGALAAALAGAAAAGCGQQLVEFPLPDGGGPMDLAGADLVDLAGADLSPLDQSPLDQSTVDQSTVDQSAIDQSTVDQSPDLTAPPDMADHCKDGKRDVDESDIDCGGSCPGCAPGQHCFASTDCASGVCLGTFLCM
jgi:hypothetical protein